MRLRELLTESKSPGEYVYHASYLPNLASGLKSIAARGLVPSKDGYAGPGVYFAYDPDGGFYHVDKEDATLFRVKWADLVNKFGVYPTNKDGIQRDDEEIIVPGAVPANLLELEYFPGEWWDVRSAISAETHHINEVFNQPYKLTWEKSDHGDVDAYAKMEDGKYVSIMFNHGYNDDNEEAWSVEFFRDNSQEITGDGNAMRVFATVLFAIKTFIKKYKPARIIFSASKEVEQGQNSQSRANLYDSMVQRYARSWGYRAFRAEAGNKVVYELTSLKISEDEIDEGWKDSIANLAIAGGIAAGGMGGMMAKQATQDYFKEPTAAVAQATTKAADTPKTFTQAKQQPSAPAALKAEPTKPSQPVLVKPVTDNPLEVTLLKVAKAQGLTGTELAAFMAQCAHETLDFKRLVEFGGSLDFRKYDPKYAPKKAKALGNKQVGDGARYKGRGFIQITGRWNYKQAGEELGLPLEKQPELVEKPEIAAKVAVWFWKHRVKPNVDNFHDVNDVTKQINPGMRGIENRKDTFKTYMKVATAGKGSGDNA